MKERIDATYHVAPRVKWQLIDETEKMMCCNPSSNGVLISYSKGT